jgi:hypothetical protein
MSKRLEAMRANPRGNWTISDVEALCKEFGVFCAPPRGGGSHYKIAHPKLADNYIRDLVDFIDRVILVS